MQPCPRQASEAVMASQIAHQSHWRANGACSYCGSISADTLFAAIEAGARLTPTDKNYKVYVTVANPHASEQSIMGSANHEQTGAGWVKVTEENIGTLPRVRMAPTLGQWVLLGAEPATTEAKFYFQHLTDAERDRFVELLNAKKINLEAPGYFYRLPFFCVPLPKGGTLPS